MMLCEACGGLMISQSFKRRNCIRTEYTCAWCEFKDFGYTHIVPAVSSNPASRIDAAELKPVSVHPAGFVNPQMARHAEQERHRAQKYRAKMNAQKANPGSQSEE